MIFHQLLIGLRISDFTFVSHMLGKFGHVVRRLMLRFPNMSIVHVGDSVHEIQNKLFLRAMLFRYSRDERLHLPDAADHQMAPAWSCERR